MQAGLLTCRPARPGFKAVPGLAHTAPTSRAARRAAPTTPPSTSSTRAASSPTPTPSTSSPTPYYDWRAQWYPIAYTSDLPLDSPVQAWLFDEPLVVARRSTGPPIAFHDACPHRRAALSEGRITASGRLQCAYHGWTFEGGSGACVGIPHLPGESSSASTSARACARALPCVEEEGMVWVCPNAAPPLGPPVGIKELAAGGAPWATADFVRSFPVDASLIIENLVDPDHGLAHQTLSLDTYSAGGPDGKRMTVVSGTGRGGGLHLVGTVPATPVLGIGAAAAKKKKGKGEKETAAAAAAATAVLEFEAPGFIRWGRVGPAGEPPTFLATFWVLPEGVGRCKLFIRYARSFGTRLKVPRWLVAVGLLHFLDQDTFLVASQQRDLLGAEAKAAGEGVPFKRAAVLAYRNPSEAYLSTLGKWLDASLPAQPNRAVGLTAWGGAHPPLTREVVLDRWVGHTAYVPSSKKVYERAKAAAGVLGVVALVSLAVVVAAVAVPGGPGLHTVAPWAALPLASALAARASAWLASRFKYCFPREEQVRDLRKIAALAPGVE